ncbi:hypothetical protein DMUE_6133, partial [Dictyocoela muelleri]
MKSKINEIFRIMLDLDTKIGGENVILEVDETVISRSGNVRCPSVIYDNLPGTIWLFGVIERNNPRNFRLCVMPDRKINTITNILEQFVNKNSIIVSDGYPSYPKAIENVKCKHIIVPHTEGFVNEDGESTNKIENLWSHLKGDIRKNHGVRYDNIDNFLTGFSFRKKYLTNTTPKEK